MRGSADLISRSILEVHDVFKEAYHELSMVLKTLESLQMERDSSRSSLNDIQECQSLTALMVKAKEYIASEQYYRALTTIETLRDALLLLGMRPFATILQKWLSELIEQLLAAAKADLQTWLTDMQANNSVIGQTFMRLWADGFVRDHSLAQGLEVEELDRDMAPLISISTETVLRLAEVYHWDLLDYTCHIEGTIPLDFAEGVTPKGRLLLDTLSELSGPLHKALHMHNRLGRIDELQEMYCESRELIIVHNLINSNLEARIDMQGIHVVFPEVLHSLCGFFCTESILRRSLSNPDNGGVFTWNQLKDLWLIACNLARDCLLRHAHSVQRVEEILQLKEEVILAAETAADDAFGFRDGALFELCTVLWEPFLALLVDSVAAVTTDCLSTLAYQPMYVASEFVHEEMIKPFFLDKAHFSVDNQAGSKHVATMSTNASLDALEEEQMEKLMHSIASMDDPVDAGRESETGSPPQIRPRQSNFTPHTLPFSEMVPRTLKHLHLMLIYCSQFVVHNDALGERGSAVCTTVEKCVTQICRLMHEELTRDGPETPLSKACQIYVDACTLSYGCQWLREAVATMLIQSNWIESIDSYLDNVIGRCRSNMLDSLANQSQDMIFELLNGKVVDLLGSMCFVNWVPTVLPSGPHEFVEEIIDYLRVTFMWLSHLPQTVREAAHFTCCSRINNEIIAFLLSAKVVHLNLLAVKALVMDFSALERFADSCGIAQLRECFAQGKTLVNAMIHHDLPSFGDDPPILRKANFPLLDIFKLAPLVEKVLDR